MKKILTLLMTSALLASSAFARHMIVQEETETTITESSPKLSMTFY